MTLSLHDPSRGKDAYPEQHALLQLATEANYKAIMARSRLITDLGRETGRIVNANASPRSRLAQLYELADRVAALVAPNTPACVRGCAHCCHIAVTLSSLEAAFLGERIGLKPVERPEGGVVAMQYHPNQRDGLVETYTGTPCTFLKGGECSIYDARPIACRLHHTLAHSNFFCSLDIQAEESNITTMNTMVLQAGICFLSGPNATFADLRAFFPARA